MNTEDFEAIVDEVRQRCPSARPGDIRVNQEAQTIELTGDQMDRLLGPAEE